MADNTKAALPKPLVKLCNQIAADRAKPYTLATARDLRQEVARRLRAGEPLADVLRALQRDRSAAAVTAAAVDACTPGIEKLVLHPVVLQGRASSA